MDNNDDFLTLAQHKRYSCRNYDERPVAEDDLQAVLQAGRVAPTAANRQPQRILVLNTPDNMRKLATCTHYAFNAPAALIVCYNRLRIYVRRYDGKEFGDVDATIVTTHMMLEAAERGMGTCWVGSFNPFKLREAFCIPDEFEPSSILILGYPDEEDRPHALHSQRFDLSATVFDNDFETPWGEIPS